jgi:excisionase family DNA binding protein
VEAPSVVFATALVDARAGESARHETRASRPARDPPDQLGGSAFAEPPCVLRVVLSHQEPHQPGTDPTTKNLADREETGSDRAHRFAHMSMNRSRHADPELFDIDAYDEPSRAAARPKAPPAAIKADRRHGQTDDRETSTAAANSRVWTVSEAAVLLGVSRAHAYELVARGQLRHVRLGRRVVVPKRAVDELLETRTA